MTVIGHIHHISYEVGDKHILKNINATMKQQHIIGIVGHNGAGKTTLFDIIAGHIQPSDGHLEWIQRPTIRYFKQEEPAWERTNRDSTQAKYEKMWNVQMNQPFDQLSGGQKMKVRLAEAFAGSSDCLLLDEPTNHLDQDSLQTFIQLVKEYKGTCLIISHDRYFLDEVATDIWEMNDGILTEYEGNYSTYRKLKEEHRLAQQREYEAQQKKIHRIESQIANLQNWSDKAHRDSTKQEGKKEYYRMKAKKMDIQIRSRRKRLTNELEKHTVERPEDEKSIHFELEGGKKKGHRILQAKNVSKTFGDKILWKNANFTIGYGERVALIGQNGAGKSTFLQMVMGEESGQGELWKSEAISIGYLKQTVFDLPDDQTPEQWLSPEDFDTRADMQTLLIHLGFRPSQWHEPIALMSMGERMKLKLIHFILEEKDMLILDEPTNHLDLPSREELEETLAAYPGTILFVTHDRYFIEKLATQLVVFENQSVTKIPKTYREWKDAKEETDVEKKLLALDTERQAVLGELSFLLPSSPRYVELDRRFTELTVEINECKRILDGR